MKSYIDELDRTIFPFVQYGDYADRYPSLSVQAFPRQFYEEIRHASEGLFAIFCKATQVFQVASDDFIRHMDMPENLIPYLHKPNCLGFPTWLSRFDFVLDRAGQLRMVELNADTPCFLIESYYANGVAASFVGQGNPNKGEREKLGAFLKNLYEVSQNFIKGPFVFSCFDDYPEDLGTTKFLMAEMQAMLPNRDIRFLSFYDMAIDQEGIILPDGTHAGGLYRLHPLEILVDEKTPEGEPLGEYFLELYQRGAFSLFNPPEAIILQNKSFMSLVYALYLTEQFFTSQERKLIESYLVPSFFESDFENLGDGQYIQKEIWGREGRNVCVIAKEAERKYLHLEKQVDHYDEIICRESAKVMYQEFIRQKSFIHQVDSGFKKGCLTLSCFMLGAEASAVGCRFSPEEIAGTEAYFVPLVISD